MTAPAAETTTAPTTLAGDLVLARLLPPTKRPPAPKRVRIDVGRFFRAPLSDERWQETIDGLAGTGLVTASPMRLTEAGRARALDFLGASELPTKCNWGTIQAKYLVPKALGLDGVSPEARKLGRADNLAALLLKRHFGLSEEVPATVGRVFDALACRKIGLPETTLFKQARATILSKLIGSEERLNSKDLNKKLPRVLLGTKQGGMAGLRAAALQGWADGGAAPSATRLRDYEPEAPATETAVEEPSPAEFDLPAFARTVKAAAHDCPTGRFGDNKVFIGHVWRRLRDEPGVPTMDLPAFKERLTEANNARLLTLSRADLVEVMNPADVQESETRYLNAEFHFVLLEKEQP